MEPSTRTILLALQGVACGYPGHTVVHDLSFAVGKGEMVALLGSSGCGKSTILRAIAGLTPLQQGEIMLNGQTISRSGYTLAPEKRHIGMVFQDYALFPHLSVEANIAYGLQKERPEQRRQMVEEMLELVGLQDLRKRYPHEISGGQQQRTALARALAPHPELILLDEPFSNLDVDLRERLSLEVRQILESQGMTGILVTHDQHEAFAWGDKVAVLHAGALRQWGSPYELYHQPVDRFVAGFIGQGAFLHGICLGAEGINTELGILQGKQNYSGTKGAPLQVLIRPDDVLPDEHSAIKAQVVRRAFKGAEILYTLRLQSGCQLYSLFPSHQDHALGDWVSIRVATDHLVAFPERACC
ncbi:ABC transporter ATP-binding protein [Candidatus Magnetaquicoccus inordinatus]|uniref:ABC transporter ATP-binding protein n=1 Tax=Candidatus Magnetaquicoccus inordinatus TaxID=2496818 RepID=UPI00102C7031|nr:ABC transporter ATP-binding protein [Candidatus Magnetaquicoccus inordinatus]